MRALAKLFSFLDKILAAFFVELLPELLRLIVLAIFILWKHCKHISSSYKYTSTINKKSSKFACNRNLDEYYCCSICLSEFAGGDEAKQLVDCRHVFHGRCLERWLRCYGATCPLCRSVVVPEVIVKEYNQTRIDRENDDRIHKELALILLKVLHAGSCRHGFF
ncbi:hypothetical protein C2S52_006254 [Perilla frutescens var. hirtella]|uniref:RING-type domain-containing protein n=1 Tax=Perilla frutescens var. hirtella TaxID=608512 RepID=A0AAD4JJ46_PERFH|nr:hypothetical protein C2S51_009529 [Perilla frutescens var. frutescens]KAH6786702.1 hypothetical protein C2S52_006254 [Perilla frutescens var. hirtella]KAH6834727.1 hypothetical protein C2S53_003964 [Perilla frutescens var. hirtella]